jgi:hypothetical protein
VYFVNSIETERKRIIELPKTFIEAFDLSDECSGPDKIAALLASTVRFSEHILPQSNKVMNENAELLVNATGI